MRLLAWTLAGFIGVCTGLSGQASAGVKVTEKTRYYRIEGATGAALLKAMDRHGPKHGFLTRAIAQTSYSIAWRFVWAETSKACRVKRADGEIAVTYTFPQPVENLSPTLKRRWRKFFAGVKEHERMHGEIARQMAKAVEKSVRKLEIRNDPGCHKTRNAVKQRTADIYGAYESKQNAFDVREHGEGGYVETMIDALVRGGGA